MGNYHKWGRKFDEFACPQLYSALEVQKGSTLYGSMLEMSSSLRVDKLIVERVSYLLLD